VRSIAEEIERSLASDHGRKPYRREGEREARWILLDYVDFVVHVFNGEERDYYDLERLWSDADLATFGDSSERAGEPAAAPAP
jgi:ribosome-associated protein